MFAGLAQFDVRFRWLIVALWIGGVIAGIRLLPGLSSVSQSNNASFLPASSLSVRAAALGQPFQGKNASSSATAIIVASRASGPLTLADNVAIGRLEQMSRQVPGVALVRETGQSADGKAAEILVTVTPAGSSGGNPDTIVAAIRAGFEKARGAPGLGFHLTGPMAVSVDASNTHAGAIVRLTLLFAIVLLFVVYRAVLAPLITLIPAALSVALAGPIVAEAARAGLPVSPVSQQLLIVLVIGAGSDYGLFLSYRVREEIATGKEPRQALIAAVERVGEAITYSGLTVGLALLTLLLAPFSLYRGLGPAMAIGIAVLLAASLTLTPALLAIFGGAAFWPSHPRPGRQRSMLWGRVAAKAVRHPVVTLAAGVVIFGALAAGMTGYRTAGLVSSPPAGSDSAAGNAVLGAHFPKATLGADQVLLRFDTPVWADPGVLGQAQSLLAADPVFRSITGPLGSGPGSVSPAELASLHATLGPAAALPPGPPESAHLPARLYQVYRATAQFISPDGRTVQYYAVLRPGPVSSPAAAGAIPQARDTLAAIAHATRARDNGIAGQDALAYDIQSGSNNSLRVVIPLVLVLIVILLALLLRSLIAPWYLAVTVGLSYLASLGFAMIVFVHLGGKSGLIFVLPLLMFVFSMALGEDYNILVMSRIREEARKTHALSEALTRAIGVTGSTVTAAGAILAGTFAVLGLAGGNDNARQLGFSIAFGVVLDTFFVRTLLVPSVAMLLGRRNWWPSGLSRPPATPGAAAGHDADHSRLTSGGGRS
jgi:putative drug exporter of the RND superfamily